MVEDFFCDTDQNFPDLPNQYETAALLGSCQQLWPGGLKYSTLKMCINIMAWPCNGGGGAQICFTHSRGGCENVLHVRLEAVNLFIIMEYFTPHPCCYY